MNKKELLELSDQELLEKAKKLKSKAIVNAVIIGFLIGVVIYGVVKNGFGFFAIIPLYLVYKIVNNANDKDLKKVLVERNLI